MANNYFRLVCFVVNICPEPLREFFIQLAKKDAGTSYTSLDAYLTRRKPDITQLNKKKIIKNDQLNKLFPGHGTANESQWDVTLLVTLIINLFPTTILPLEEYAITEIRNIRNDLQHISNTANISNSDFSRYWGRLESAVTTLAHKVFGAARQASFKTKIDELKKLKKKQLTNLVECLLLWHEETVREKADIIQDLKTKLISVESNTSETASVLRQVIVRKPGPDGDGDKNKRFKSVDNILKQLQGSFESTIKELPDNFNAPGEVADIRTKLRDKHFVVVTGSYNSRYFESALAAVTGMEYNYKRCVEMQKSSDWRHIDPEDVDFVLCREPFGSIAYDDNKAKGMADIFNSMKYTSNGDRSGKRIDFMIVTDFTILTECRRSHDHDMLDEVVKVFDATTEEQPVDLASFCGRVNNTNSSSSQVTSNLRVLTDNFLRQYSITSGQVDTEFLNEARNKFKKCKAIVLTGPKKCGKTSAAVALASKVYLSPQCLLLTEPNDVKIIDFQNICLVIIDEFAGMYRYEETEVYKWYSMFDHLYYAVTAGQINVIITCEKSKLAKCSVEISPHPLLEHRVDFPERIMIVKQEATDVEDEYNGSTDRLQILDTHHTSSTSSAAVSRDPADMSVVPFQQHNQNSGGTTSKKNAKANDVTTQGTHQIQLPGMHPLSVHSSHVQGRMTYNLPGHNSDPSQDFVSRVLQQAYNSSQQGQSTPSAPPGKSPNKIPITYAPGILHPSPPPPTLEHPLAILRTSDIRSNSATPKPNAVTLPGYNKSTEIQSVARVSNSITISARSSTRPHVWSVKTNVKKSIKVSGDKSKCDILGCCQLPSGEILLADNNNRKLKKLDAGYQVIGICDLPNNPCDVCYIGNNEAVVSLFYKLQYVDVTGMTLTRSVDTKHDCRGLVCHGNKLYVTDGATVWGHCLYVQC